MQTILVATDFSNASHNAFVYGLGMARAFGAKLILFHSCQLPVAASLEPVIPLPEIESDAIVQDRLRQHLLAVDTSGITVELLQATGPVSSSIIETATAHQAGVIICGIQEGSRLFRRLFGSTVTDLATHTPIPLIAVPASAHYQPPHTIALASDIVPEEGEHTLDMLSEIGLRFHSKVYIVRVLSDRFDEVYELKHHPTHLHRLSRALETQYAYTQHKDVSDALSFLVQTMPVQLLAIVPHQHSMLERLFFGSTTKAMIAKTTVPLLVLPDQKG
jgi:nucleotide-binding universal stress UspA family protein